MEVSDEDDSGEYTESKKQATEKETPSDRSRRSSRIRTQRTEEVFSDEEEGEEEEEEEDIYDDDDDDDEEEEDDDDDHFVRRSMRVRTAVDYNDNKSLDSDEEEGEEEDSDEEEGEEEDDDEEEGEEEEDDEEEEEEEDDDDEEEEEEEEEAVEQIDKIVAYRVKEVISEPISSELNSPTRKRHLTQSPTRPSVSDAIFDVKNDGEKKKTKKMVEEEEEYEYLLKFKSLSYLHCRWESTEFILDQYRGDAKLKKFHSKYSLSDFDTGYFPEDYTIVDRVIKSSVEDGNNIYLVKWEGLRYKEATWEYDQYIPKEKIEQFNKHQVIPTAWERAKKIRPAAKKWKKMEKPPKYKGGNELRDYQFEALNWLNFCYHHKINNILADEMGLGKTIQAISFMQHLQNEMKIRGPFLVVAPLSCIRQWKREVEIWTDMNAIVYYGDRYDRDLIEQFEFSYYNETKRGRRTVKKKVPNCWKFNVLITTYELCIKDSRRLGKIPWQYCVVDEGHRLKNIQSKLLGVLRGFKREHTTLLTGTPLQNNLKELWSLLNFLNPKKFPDLEEFLLQFGDLGASDDVNKNVEKLHTLISSYLLRRKKENVEKEIPPKEEIVIEVVLTRVQKTYYRALLDKNRKFLRRGVKRKANVPRLINVLMQIRKCCNHPYLIEGVENKVTEKMTTLEQVNQSLITTCSKIQVLDKLLKKLKAEGGHRVLIFSQMVRVLNILEDYCNYRKFPTCRLDGGILGMDRQQQIDQFCHPNSKKFIFLLSTRAGGLGLNLEVADTVIIYDSDWNPQNDIQAQARAHRIGQKAKVKVYRLLTKNTYEKQMFDTASRKLGLEQVVLGQLEGGNRGIGKEKLRKEEVERLLKFGAYHAFKENNDEEEKMLQESDIDDILKRNATIVNYGGEDSVQEKTLFSKAVFNLPTSGNSISLDDEDFWDKVLPEDKSSRGLIIDLEDEKKLNTEEEQKEFLKIVEGLIQERLGELERYEQPSDSLLEALLTQIIYCTKFGDDKRAIIRSYFEQIDKKAYKRAVTGDRIEFDRTHLNETDEDYMYKDHVDPFGGWNKSSLMRFRRPLLLYGFGDWERIQKNDLFKHPIEEIHSLAENMLWQLEKICEDYINQPDLEYKVKNPENVLIFLRTLRNYHFPAEIDEVEKEEVVVEDKMETDEKEEKVGKKKLEIQVDPLKPFHAAKLVNFEYPKELVPLKVEDITFKIVEIQKDQIEGNRVVRIIHLEKEEREKITNVAVPGFSGKFMFKLSCFYTIKGEMKQITRYSDSFEVAGSHPILKITYWRSNLRATFNPAVKKLKLLHNIEKLIKHLKLEKFVAHFSKNETEDEIKKKSKETLAAEALKTQEIIAERDEIVDSVEVPTLKLRTPTYWWNDLCDMHLVLSVPVYGYGSASELRKNTLFSIKKTFEDECKNMKLSAINWKTDGTLSRSQAFQRIKVAEASFPPYQVLNKRVFRVVNKLLAKYNLFDAEENLPIKVHKEWTGSERKNVVRCLKTWGLSFSASSEEKRIKEEEKAKEVLVEKETKGVVLTPDWNHIIIKSKLRKDKLAVRKYLKRLLKMVQELADEEKKSLDALFDDIDDEEEKVVKKEEEETESDVNETMSDVVSDLLVIGETPLTPEDVNMEDEEVVVIEEKPVKKKKPSNEFGIGAKSARKILRCIFAQKLFAKFVLPVKDKYLSKFPTVKSRRRKKGEKLPEWYKGEVHDVMLIDGVVKFGFDLDKLVEEHKELVVTKLEVKEKKKRRLTDAIFLGRIEDMTHHFKRQLRKEKKRLKKLKKKQKKRMSSPSRKKLPGKKKRKKKKKKVVSGGENLRFFEEIEIFTSSGERESFFIQRVMEMGGNSSSDEEEILPDVVTSSGEDTSKSKKKKKTMKKKKKGAKGSAKKKKKKKKKKGSPKAKGKKKKSSPKSKGKKKQSIGKKRKREDEENIEEEEMKAKQPETKKKKMEQTTINQYFGKRK